MQEVSSFVGLHPKGICLGDLLDVPSSTKYVPRDLDFSAGKVSVGMQNLADRFIVTLFNILGSTKHDPDFGTSLMSDLLLGSSMNFGVVQSAVAVAVSEAERQIILDDENGSYSDGAGDDEMLESAVCDNVLYNPGGSVLKMYVSLTSKAGESYTYVLPANLAFPE